MYNICFMARPSYDKFSAAIFDTIRNKYDKDAKGYFITMNQKESKYVSDTLGNKNAIVCEVSKFFRENWDEFTYDRFCEFESKYECSPIWSIIYTDRYLINRDYNYAVKITTGYFMFFENIFAKNKVDFYYDETIATLQSYIGYIVGLKHGVKYLCQMTARGGLDATYHYFVDEPFQMDMLFNSDYKDTSYTSEERVKADNYLSEFENRDVKPVNMVFTGQKPRFKLKYLAYPALYIIKRLNPYYNDKFSYMYYENYKGTFDPLVYYFRYNVSKKYYNKADYSKKYVYFPLHYQPEASTIVCAPKYEKQLFFIDSWAKSLPADTVLYVKEHYAILGNRELSFYKELKKYPNVILIDPWESSRKLIENSVAVTTLTGTAGWESMLLRKPVFLGGEIFFSNAPGVIKTNEIFGNYIEMLNKYEMPSRDDIIQYLCEYFRTLRRGNVYSADERSLEKDNIELVTGAFTQQMNIVLEKARGLETTISDK